MKSSTNLVWPHRILGYGATPKQAKKLAEEIIAIFGNDPLGWLQYGRFEVKDEKKDAGGLQALCIPMYNDRFRFVIWVNKDDHPMRKPFLVAHETAHTFFYIRNANVMPKRALATNSLNGGNPWEETFCDTFAQRVIGYSYKEVGLPRDHRN